MTLAPDFETSRTGDVAGTFPFAALRRLAVVLVAGFGALAVFVAVMSTPTAAGMIAPSVAITLPTVAPIPQCTSGMAATCL